MLQKLRAGLPPPSFPLVLNSAANTVSTSLLACKHRCNIDATLLLMQHRCLHANIDVSSCNIDACSCNIDATSLQHRCDIDVTRVCKITAWSMLHRSNIAATSMQHRCNKSLQNHCMVNVTSLQTCSHSVKHRCRGVEHRCLTLPHSRPRF